MGDGIRLSDIYFLVFKYIMPKVLPSRNRTTAEAAASSTTSVRTLLAPNTDIGQHFLKNPAVVESIVARAFGYRFRSWPRNWKFND